MPVTLSYPGVYIEEVPSGVRTITGVATSITAFVGRALRGPVDTDDESPVRIYSFAAYERIFGGLWNDSPMSFAVQQYFQNGGSDALIVRVHFGAMPSGATITLSDGTPIKLLAANPGAWGNNLRVRIDHVIDEETNTANVDAGFTQNTLFNLQVKDLTTNLIETHLNVSSEFAHPRFMGAVLKHSSTVLRGFTAPMGGRPVKNDDPAVGIDPFIDDSATKFKRHDEGGITYGTDGDPVGVDQISKSGLAASKAGLYALEKADLFNILCIPPFASDKDTSLDTWKAAIEYATKRRAMVLVDPPFITNAWSSPSNVTNGAIAEVAARSANAALYFPRLRITNPLKGSRPESFAPSGVVAGVIARTDASRGVWKSPAGIDTTLSGVLGLEVNLTDPENGAINQLGVNCLRNFPNTGPVVWGARTLRGSDSLASEWKYLAVRRTALFIEESLYRGTQWVVFEPNDEPLWSQIRLNIGAFMQNLFRQGAFQGKTPREAYFVKCDRETTTQTDINSGIVNIVVGFAPLKPAEFVVIKLQQMAGDIPT